MSEIGVQRLQAPTLIPVDRGPTLVAGVTLVLASLAISQAVDWRQTLLFGIGALLGVALYHGSFGFTGGWRRLRSRQARAAPSGTA